MLTQLDRQFADGSFSDKDEELRRETLIATAIVGREAQQWFESTVGRYVIGAAIEEQRAIEQQIVRTPAWRKRKLQSLRNEHRAIELALGWIGGAVYAGTDAEQQLELEEATE